MSYIYKTKGTCSTQIEVELDGNIVKNVKFTGGCQGNLQAIPRLVEGMTVEEVERRISAGMVWQSAGVVSAFQTTGTDYCGGSSDRKCSTVTFKRLKLYGYGYGDKSAFRHDFCKRG